MLIKTIDKYAQNVNRYEGHFAGEYILNLYDLYASKQHQVADKRAEGTFTHPLYLVFIVPRFKQGVLSWAVPAGLRCWAGVALKRVREYWRWRFSPSACVS